MRHGATVIGAVRRHGPLVNFVILLLTVRRRQFAATGAAMTLSKSPAQPASEAGPRPGVAGHRLSRPLVVGQ